MSEPTRRTRSAARAATGHATRRRRLAAAVTAVVVVLAGAAGFAWWRLDANISRLDISGSLASDRPTVADGPLNILLIGSDTRVGQDAPDAAQVSGARSDTTLIAHLSADRKHVTVVSVPRDSMVPMPPKCDASVPKSNWPVQQINSAFAIGGPACLVNTIEGNTDIFINHVAVVDFAGFKGMVDALGGVPVCTPIAINDPKAHLKLAAGRHVLDGTQALGYVRVRYTEGDGSDLGRIKRQQAFLSSIVQEATRTSLLLRPDRLYGFLDAATRSLTTDDGLGLGTMKDIATSVKDIGIQNVAFATVPVEAYPKDPNRVQWTDAAETLWKAIRTDQPITGKPERVADTVRHGHPAHGEPRRRPGRGRQRDRRERPRRPGGRGARRAGLPRGHDRLDRRPADGCAGRVRPRAGGGRADRRRGLPGGDPRGDRGPRRRRPGDGGRRGPRRRGGAQPARDRPHPHPVGLRAGPHELDRGPHCGPGHLFLTPRCPDRCKGIA